MASVFNFNQPGPRYLFVQVLAEFWRCHLVSAADDDECSELDACYLVHHVEVVAGLVVPVDDSWIYA